MSNNRYTVYPGHFICQTCSDKVHSLRLYASEKKLTWMCKEKHMSEVSLKTRKKKADYERKR